MTVEAPLEHGKINTYQMGCRCDACRWANAAYFSNWMAEHPTYYQTRAIRLRHAAGKTCKWCRPRPSSSS
jgi:hypothetical protein